MDCRKYFVETMCGIVANPVAQMWNGLGRNPHLASVGKYYVVRDVVGRGRGFSFQLGIICRIIVERGGG